MTSKFQNDLSDTERHCVVSFRKQELKEFLSICGVTPVTIMGIGLQSEMERTKRRNITEVSDAMVLILQTLSPRHHSELWDELGRSEKLCEAFNTTKTNKFGLSQSFTSICNNMRREGQTPQIGARFKEF